MGGAIGADEHDPGSNLPLGMITIVEPGLRVPIKTWLPPVEIDAGAMDQLRNAASHPAVGTTSPTVGKTQPIETPKPTWQSGITATWEPTAG